MSEDNSQEITGSPVPYEDGDHCVFYAIQEASLFFRNQALTKADRSRYQKGRERFKHIGKMILGEDTWSRNWLNASLRFINTKLTTIGVSVSSIICSEETKQCLEGDNLIKHSAIPIEIIEEDVEYTLTYPVLLVVQGKSDTHVWCVTSEEKFQKDYGEHINTDDTIVLVANLKRD